MNTELDRLNLQDSLTAAKEMILNIIDNNADIFDEEKIYIVKSEIENIFFDLTEKVWGIMALLKTIIISLITAFTALMLYTDYREKEVYRNPYIINLDKGKKFVSISGSVPPSMENLVVVTRDMKPGESPQSYEVHVYDIRNKEHKGKIYIKEQ